MPFNPKTKLYKRLMQRIREQYPTYGLARRKRILNAIYYQKIRKKKR